MNNYYLTTRLLCVLAITTAAIIGVAASPLLTQQHLAQGKIVMNYAHLRIPIAVSGDNGR